MMAAQKSTIDPAGRLVVPRAVRRAARLEAGAPLEITWEQDHIEIRPATMPMFVAEEEGVYVVRPKGELPPLTSEVVEETLDQVRKERG